MNTMKLDLQTVAGCPRPEASRTTSCPLPREREQGQPPTVSRPRPESLRLESPRLESPRLESPRLESPRLESPRPESPRLESPRPESLRPESLRLTPPNWVEGMRNELIRRLATSTPDQVLGSLGQLVADGKIVMEEANGVYTEARRLQLIMEARQSVMKAAEDVVVHNLRSVGCARSEMSEIQFSEVRVKFQQAVDDLIVQTQRANTMTWKLHVLPKL